MPLIRLKPFVLTLVMLALMKVQAMAQHNKWNSNLILEGRVHYGYLINHHLEMRIFNAHFPAFEINIGKETDGSERWQSEYNYPVIGISYWYSNLGNSSFLGSANAVFPYINYPVIKTRRSQVNFRLGVGVAYISKPFDRLDNYKYIAIGSHINAAINLMGEYRHQISPRLNVVAGLSAMHMSNGSTKTPNYGINTPMVSIGAAYRLNKVTTVNSVKLKPALYTFEFPEKKTLDFYAGNIVAFKDMGSEYGKNFMIYNFYGSIMKQLSFKTSAGIELNITHNQSDVYIAERDSLSLPLNGKMRLAIAPMFEIRTGRLSYDLGLGIYMYEVVIPAFAYFKLGFKYLVTPHIFAGLALHTHYGQADFVGIGIGYKFSGKYKGKL